MDITIIRIAGEILVTASILGIIYSVIRYLGVFIGDRKISAGGKDMLISA